MENVSVLRTLRLLRLLRIVRLFAAFRELWALIRGLLGCLRTLLWAAGLVFLMLTVWAIFAVELLDPLMKDMDGREEFATCYWCSHAFSSVMHANLTFFQMISGDGWSVLARPVIEQHPWTAFIFLGVIFSMQMGLLNLVTAVIVDNAAHGRMQDDKFVASERALQREQAKRSLFNIFMGLDTDQSGSMSLAELRAAARDSEEFQNILNIMDIDKDDLLSVFTILDADESGDVDYSEFTEQLWKMKSQSSHTLLIFLKHYVGLIWKNTKKQNAQIALLTETAMAQSAPTDKHTMNLKDEMPRTPPSEATASQVSKVVRAVSMSKYSLPKTKTMPHNQPPNLHAHPDLELAAADIVLPFISGIEFSTELPPLTCHSTTSEPPSTGLTGRPGRLGEVTQIGKPSRQVTNQERDRAARQPSKFSVAL